MSCTSRAAKTLSNRSRPSSDARVFLVPRLHDRGEWFTGYRVWDLGNTTFSLEPWHTLVCHVVCIRAKNPVVVLLRYRSDLQVICCNPSHWSFGSQPFESKRLCDAAQEGITCHCNHSPYNTFNPLGQPRCRGPPSSSAAVWTI